MSKATDVYDHAHTQHNGHQFDWSGLGGGAPYHVGMKTISAQQLGVKDGYAINCFAFVYKCALEQGAQKPEDAIQFDKMVTGPKDSRVKAFYKHWYYGLRLKNYPNSKPSKGDICFFKNKVGNIFAHVCLASGTKTENGFSEVLSFGHDMDPSVTTPDQPLRVCMTSIDDILTMMRNGGDACTVSFLTPDWGPLAS